MRIATVLFILFLSPVTHAHPEYVGWTGGDFASGMAHVLSGLDHWATWLVLGSLLAVSSWRWRIPVRCRIQSSEVSTRRASSSLVSTRAGR